MAVLGRRGPLTDSHLAGVLYRAQHGEWRGTYQDGLYRVTWLDPGFAFALRDLADASLIIRWDLGPLTTKLRWALREHRGPGRPWG